MWAQSTQMLKAVPGVGEYLFQRALESLVRRPDPDLAMFLLDFRVRAGLRRSASWQRWFEFCENAPGVPQGRSYRDILDEQYRRP